VGRIRPERYNGAVVQRDHITITCYRVAYDGRPFHGFQRQPTVPTVEDALLDALATLGVLEDADERGGPDGYRATPPGYAAAGRTDAGVSALAQTVAFAAPDWCTPRALNAELPASVRAWAAATVPDEFHATHHARSRTYVYYLYAPVGRRGDATAAFDDDRARAAAAALSGTNDFHNLTPDAEGTVRDLSVELAREGPVLVVTVSAGGFARELVRRVASLVRAVGAGDVERAHVGRILGPEPVDGPEGIPAAPATPLVLVDVDYPDVSFRPDPEAVASARAAFGDRHREGLLAARVHGRIRDGIGADGGPVRDDSPR
jgi:tRNA pseudouridine38-40 synthase